MKARLKGILKKAIQNACDEIVETTEYSEEEIWWTEELVGRMTEAAVLIYEQNKETQKYLVREGYW